MGDFFSDFLIYFLRQTLSLNLQLSVLARLCICLILLDTRVTGIHHYALKKMLGISTHVLMLAQQSVCPMEPSCEPQNSHIYLCIPTNWLNMLNDQMDGLIDEMVLILNSSI